MKKAVIVILLLFTLTGCTKVKSYKEATVKDFVDLIMEYETGKKTGVIYIDLRPLGTDEGKEEGTFAESHVQGFINYNVKNGKETEMVTWLKGMYDTKTAVILIDSDGTDVRTVAKWLTESGYKKVYYYEDGFSSLKEKAQDMLHFVSGIEDCGCGPGE